MNEADFQKKITDLCEWLGLLYHHETDSRKSKKGFPDLCIVGSEGKGVLFLELKGDRRGARPTPEQEKWLSTLKAAGVRAYLVYPKDWPAVRAALFMLAGRKPPE